LELLHRGLTRPFTRCAFRKVTGKFGEADFDFSGGPGSFNGQKAGFIELKSSE
jgi:hypothetical protein